MLQVPEASGSQDPVILSASAVQALEEGWGSDSESEGQVDVNKDKKDN